MRGRRLEVERKPSVEQAIELGRHRPLFALVDLALQHHQQLDQRCAQELRVTDPAGHGDGLPNEGAAPLALRLPVVAGDGQPGEQSGQHRVVLTDRAVEHAGDGGDDALVN